MIRTTQKIHRIVLYSAVFFCLIMACEEAWVHFLKNSSDK